MVCTRSSTPRIISYTTPENISLEDAVTKSGATLTYGPYRNVPPLSANFMRDHQMPISIHYHHDQPVLEVTKLKRTAEISHWGANLNIQDEIHLHNAGPA
jgi:oligosaccharyltransferase complex subunit alpha (ribophorin I)